MITARNPMNTRALPLLSLLLLSLGATPTALQAGDVPFSRGWVFDQRDGQALYQAVCQGCHMSDAKGATGAAAYPPLAAAPRLAARQYAAMMVLNGRAAMPGFGRALDDQQVAAVINYLRSNFGNSYSDTLTPAEVAALRTTRE